MVNPDKFRLLQTSSVGETEEIRNCVSKEQELVLDVEFARIRCLEAENRAKIWAVKNLDLQTLADNLLQELQLCKAQPSSVDPDEREFFQELEEENIRLLKALVNKRKELSQWQCRYGWKIRESSQIIAELKSSIKRLRVSRDKAEHKIEMFVNSVTKLKL